MDFQANKDGKIQSTFPRIYRKIFFIALKVGVLRIKNGVIFKFGIVFPEPIIKKRAPTAEGPILADKCQAVFVVTLNSLAVLIK